MDRKEKVLVVHNYYQLAGGEDTVVANEMKLLQDNGHEVILYSRNNSELKDWNTLRKFCLPFISIFNIRTYKEIKKIITDEHIDIVHVHNTLTLISPAVYYAAKHCKKPVIQTIHNFRMLCPAATFYRDGTICEDCVEKGMKCAIKHGCYRGSKLQTFVCVINTKIHRLSGIYKKINYICLTEFNKEKLLQHGQIKEKQIFVKPNFVQSSVDIIPYEEREEYFISVGRLEKLKGTDLLLQAWRIMGDRAPKLVLCGTGELAEWARGYIEEHHLNVDYRGFVPNDEVQGLIARSKALIMCSQWYEGFPMTIAEAYAVGTPVIVGDVGNIASLVIEGETGWKYEYNSATSIAKMILNINIVNIVNNEFSTKYTHTKNYEVLHDIYLRRLMQGD